MKIALTLFLVLSGCASFISSVSDQHPNRKEIATEADAKVIMLAGEVHPTEYNNIFMVHRGAGPFRANVGRIEKDGKVIAVVRGNINWWIAGNYIYGWIPGLIGDFIVGGAYNPTPVYLKEPTPIK